MIQIPQANKTPITVYSYWRDSNANLATYKRTVIERCHFDPVSVTNKDKFGNVILMDARLVIYEIDDYIALSEFAQLPDSLTDYWTLNPGTPTSRDQSIIHVGECPYTFSISSVADIDAEVAEFRKQNPYNNYRCELVDALFVGSPRMWHVSASLKRMV